MGVNWEYVCVFVLTSADVITINLNPLSYSVGTMKTAFPRSINTKWMMEML